GRRCAHSPLCGGWGVLNKRPGGVEAVRPRADHGDAYGGFVTHEAADWVRESMRSCGADGRGRTRTGVPFSGSEMSWPTELRAHVPGKPRLAAQQRLKPLYEFG